MKVINQSLEGESQTYSKDKTYRGHPKYVSERALLYFSGGDKNDPMFPKPNIHTNLKMANQCGFNRRIASGAMLEGFVIDLLVDIWGDIWLTKGKLQLKFISPAKIGDTIIPYARVDCWDESILRLNIGCENQDGLKVCVGRALMEVQN